MKSVARICSEGDCARTPAARGMCDKHYRRRKKSDTLPPLRSEVGCTWPEYECSVRYYAKGFCHLHYRTARERDGDTPTRRSCTITGCDKFSGNRGMCQKHYRQAWTYGLTGTRLNELLNLPCGICGDSPDMKCIDHDHACCPGDRSCGNCVRGVLCKPCNTGLGYFRDSEERLLGAVEYLRAN